MGQKLSQRAIDDTQIELIDSSKRAMLEIEEVRWIWMVTFYLVSGFKGAHFCGYKQ